MQSDQLDLEDKLQLLSLEASGGGDRQVANHTKGDQLAQLIARVTADLEAQPMDEGEAVAEPVGHFSLIVTNLPASLFFDDHLKAEFEALFRAFDPLVQFRYLKSFGRARVDVTSAETAARARHHLHGTPFGDTAINCFFGRPPVFRSGSEFLALPPPVRQFLISPPASPPVGWAPAPESEPVVDFDLLTALAQLGPGGRHELLPPAQDRPAIVVHVCEEPDAAAGGATVARNRIVQTRCPNRCD